MAESTFEAELSPLFLGLTLLTAACCWRIRSEEIEPVAVAASEGEDRVEGWFMPLKFAPRFPLSPRLKSPSALLVEPLFTSPDALNLMGSHMQGGHMQGGHMQGYQAKMAPATRVRTIMNVLTRKTSHCSLRPWKT